MLGSSDLIAIVATQDPGRARDFYARVLGLRLLAAEPSALLFDAHGTMLRVSVVEGHTPAQYSVLGWKVVDIVSAVETLAARGVIFQQYEMLEQDQRGICTFPNGDRVAWFQDPDGNTLSVSQLA